MKMQTSFYITFLSFFLLQAPGVLTSSSSGNHLCQDDDAHALLQFKEMFKVYSSCSFYYMVFHSRTKSWKASADCCSWDGVTCHNITGRVVGLDLSASCLEGIIHPNSSLFRLSHLRDLNLGYTNISGVLPNSIGCLKSLNTLDLGFCQFSGVIPESIGNLTQLTELDLSNNHFNGQLLDCFANLKNLRVLYLPGYDLVGKFPTSLLNLTHLQDLDLSNNLLTGQIGDFKSKSLMQIDLENNQLTGLIPRSIFSLADLFVLHLSANNFHGIEPNVFVDSNKLQNYSSDGEVPLNTTNNFNFSLPSLMLLGLSSCKIGEFPDFLRNSPDLIQLDLSNNNIHGQVPSWLMSLDNLEVLVISHNFLTGTINQLLKTSLYYLDMSSNLLIGQLPSFICNSSSLHILDLSANNLISTIPQCLGNFSQQLQILDLGNNGLLGTIPTTFSNGCRLEVLILNNNKLEGPLPRSLAYCTNLQLLDIGNNKIDDKFPMWLETLTSLRVLILKSNRFHGAIGNSKAKSPFPQLRIVDVSYNELTGVLPAKLLMHFKNMMLRNDDYQMKTPYMKISSPIDDDYYVHSVSLVLKGVDYNLERVLTTRVVLDFSSNKFEGEIPELIGNLHSLQTLNLSHNNLRGHIPPTIGNLNMLESLDLTWNQLDGTIPVELLNLTFLQFLNLSENHLVGPIPRGRHFDTFENNSFQANLGLCGLPLSIECGSTGAAPPSTPLEFEEENDSEFFDGFTWKSVLLGYGCGLVLGIPIGSLMFLTGKPRCFIRFVDETYKLRKRPRKWIHMRT